MADTDPLLCAIDERGVAAVTLNRPAVNNAYDGALVDALIASFGRLADEPGVRCAVLRGAGRYFQAGADLTFMAGLRQASDQDNHDFSRRTLAAVRGLQLFPRPTVALIQGGCFGGGVGFAAACDIAIAAEDATFALTEVRWGINPATIIPLLVERVGARQLGRYALSGERFDAIEAQRIGLVHEICPAAELEATGARIVDALLRAAPEAVTATKRLIAVAADSPFTPELHDRIVAESANGRRGPEAVEGLASFAEKRPPRWYRSS
ncbi:MAG: enoyl-CoA hydratase/isomerase family protein [Alphaproteobacteria bacterium]|nr:enoyl-CoA hydratase/isomerase family protein [Alphaproteobacteria bacterium]